MNTSQAAFEEEMKIVFKIPPAYFCHAFKRDADAPANYWDQSIQNAWIGWQAAMRQAIPEWQPIETAPKDARILVWSGQELYAAHWAQNPFTGDEAWIVAEWGDERDQALVKPTHWMPLLAPPIAGQVKEQS